MVSQQPVSPRLRFGLGLIGIGKPCGYADPLVPDEGSADGQVEIATKFGEHWDAERGEPFVDHSYNALARSLETSAERRGRIDYLQLHKTTPEVLRIGASASDLDSARITADCSEFWIIQAPYNAGQQTFGDALEAASASGMMVAVNRPFGMGRLLH